MTYDELLPQAKARARVYLERGKVADAIASLLSDLRQGDEEARRAGKAMEALGLLYALNNDLAGARRFIEGFR
jgi:hypothetical protein